MAAATVSPEALHYGPCTRPPSLATRDPHGCFARQKPSSFSHVRPQRLCFPPQLSALCLPSPSPGADFCPPRARPAGPGCPSQGLAQDKPLVGLLAPIAAPIASVRQTRRALLSEAQAQHQPAATLTIRLPELKKQNQGEILAKQLLRCWKVAGCVRDLLFLSHRGSTACPENTEADALL